jgi:DNA-binding response OmpR family regulator
VVLAGDPLFRATPLEVRVMRCTVCVFADWEGRPRPWASLGQITMMALDGSAPPAASDACDLVVVYWPAEQTEDAGGFVRAVTSRCPLIVVLNEHCPDLVIHCLDLGAYDVVPDCISTHELFARARAIVARCAADRAGGDARPAHGTGAAITLRRSEARLFEYLVEHADRPVPQSELIANVFGGTHTTDTSLVRVHVAALRRYLGPYSHGLRTLRARGYLLDSAVVPGRELLQQPMNRRRRLTPI